MNTGKLQWQNAIPGGLTNSKEVHVWRVSLDLTASQSEKFLEILSVDELAKVGRLHFEKDKKRFIAARGMLRTLLGGYLEKKPHEIRFAYTDHGKPLLAVGTGCDNLSFNLSHSGAFALYAVTRSRNIGIDIEHVRDDVSFREIAGSFFSPGEISSLERVNKNKRPEMFFQYWTRKEAFLKAIGGGLSLPLDMCDVSLISGSVLSSIHLSGDNTESSGWYVQDLFPGGGYAAAIAVEGADGDLSCWNYSV